MKRLFATFAGPSRVVTAILMAVLCLLPASARWGEKVPNRQYADLKRFHLGFSVGLHVQDLGFTHNGHIGESGEQWQAEVPGFSPGFCVTVLGDMRLHRYLNLRFTPGMYFGSKTVTMLDITTQNTLKQDVKSAYVTLPLDLKISGDRLGNTRPYVTLGAMAAIDISKKRSEALMFNAFQPFLCVGLGCDFYLPFFKLNPEVKFCFGLSDILRHDRPDLDEAPDLMRITESLSKVKSNMVVFTFYFE